MRWLIYGDYQKYVYEEAIVDALTRLGIETVEFRTSKLITDSYLDRIQKKLLWGPALWDLRNELISRVRETKPDVLFLRKPLYTCAATLQEIRAHSPGTLIVTYNNDNPFSDGRRWQLWRLYHQTARHADLNLFYREDCLSNARRLNYPRPAILMSYYTRGLHRPLPGTRRVDDVSFIGHYEPDVRVQYLESLASAGIDVRIQGPLWNHLGRQSPLRKLVGPSAYGEEYVRLVNEARIALVFLSKRNKDEYTRRCFEIPACGSFMLCERTDLMQSLFKEGVEAEYFSSSAELIEKVRYYLKNAELRERIAQAGHRRCLQDQHDNDGRMAHLLRLIDQIRSAKSDRAPTPDVVDDQQFAKL